MSDTMDQVVWTRSYDREKQQRRTRRFQRWVLLPLAVIVAFTAVVSGPAGALGILIIGGGLGLMLGATVFLMNRNERANGVIVLRNGALVCGRLPQVPTAQVQSFTTFVQKINSTNPAMGSNTKVSATIGKAEFQLNDGKPVTFMWPSMPAAQLDEVRAALEGVLPGRWQPRQP
jgi:hypothetical protein